MKKIIFLFMSLFLASLSLQAQWTQVGGDLDGEAAGDQAGIAVAVNANGEIVAFGANMNDGNGTNAGHVRVFEFNGSAWIQKGSDIDGEAAGDFTGYSIDMNDDGNIIAVSSIKDDTNASNAGKVRVFKFDTDSSGWVQMGSNILGANQDDSMGFSVSLSANGLKLAASAHQYDNGNLSDAGLIKIFEFNGSDWTQIGSDITGTVADDLLGYAIDLNDDGTIVASGTYGAYGAGADYGHVKVFEFNGTDWVQKGSTIDGETDQEWFGNSVSLSADGLTLVSGSPWNDTAGTDAGTTRVFKFSTTTSDWVQVGSTITGEAAGDLSGFAVSLSDNGEVLATSAYSNDGNGSNSGQVRVFEFNGSDWTQAGSDIDGEAAGDIFGRSLDINNDGQYFISGAIYNDGNGTNAGHARVFKNPVLSISAIEPIDISVYPNPTDGIIFIKADNIQKIEIMDMTGRIIHEVTHNNKLDLSGKESGTYVMRIYTNKGLAITKIILR